MTPWGNREILGVRVDEATYQSAVPRILAWAREGRGRVVCCADVHLVMECCDDPDFRSAVNSADLVTADGVPLVWAQRALGAKDAARVYGPDLMRALLAAAVDSEVPVGLYGGLPETLERLVARIAAAHPRLPVPYAWAPPFRVLTMAEDDAATEAIRASGARVLFVGLGCPKQERWAVAHRDRIGAAIVCVGAAFDFLAGVVPEAPRWMQRAGCEWVFRLAVEPVRLWKRYLKHNPRFVWRCGLQLARAYWGQR